MTSEVVKYEEIILKYLKKLKGEDINEKNNIDVITNGKFYFCKGNNNNWNW